MDHRLFTSGAISQDPLDGIGSKEIPCTSAEAGDSAGVCFIAQPSDSHAKAASHSIQWQQWGMGRFHAAIIKMRLRTTRVLDNVFRAHNELFDHVKAMRALGATLDDHRSPRWISAK